MRTEEEIEELIINGKVLIFAVSLWNKAGFHAWKVSIIGTYVSNVSNPSIDD